MKSNPARAGPNSQGTFTRTSKKDTQPTLGGNEGRRRGQVKLCSQSLSRQRVDDSQKRATHAMGVTRYYLDSISEQLLLSRTSWHVTAPLCSSDQRGPRALTASGSLNRTMVAIPLQREAPFSPLTHHVWPKMSKNLSVWAIFLPLNAPRNL